MEIEFMMPFVFKAPNAIGWGGRLASLSLAVIVAGCSPEGTGTVHVDPPADVRSKMPGAQGKPDPKKEPNMLKIEEAAKKHAKLD